MMDRQSPIYAALVGQTERAITDFQQRLDLFRSGKMRLTCNNKDISAEWTERLERWLADNKRLLADLQEGRI